MLVLALEFDLWCGQLCVVDELLFERVGEGVDFVAAIVWVTPRPPTSALAAIDTAIAACLKCIFMSLLTSLRVVGSTAFIRARLAGRWLRAGLEAPMNLTTEPSDPSAGVGASATRSGWETMLWPQRDSNPCCRLERAVS